MNAIVTVLVALGLIGFISAHLRYARIRKNFTDGSINGRAVLQVNPEACIGCGKCQKRCRAGAITIEDHLAHIDPTRCRQCFHCVSVCPKHAISLVKACEIKACATQGN